MPTFVAALNAAAERRACASSQAFAAVFSKYDESISIYVSIKYISDRARGEGLLLEHAGGHQTSALTR